MDKKYEELLVLISEMLIEKEEMIEEIKKEIDTL